MPRAGLREQLLAAGLETFHRRGFNATSVQDVTDAAGAPKGSFYNHFESKEALAAEALQKYVEKSRERGSILRDPRLPPLRRLRRYFQALSHDAIEDGFAAGCLLGNFAAELSPQSPLLRRRVGEAFAAWVESIAAVIGEAQRAGEMPAKVPAKALAEFTIHAWEGAVLLAKVEKDRAPLDLFLRVTFSRILA